MSLIRCPQCEQNVEHERGYLREHEVKIVRGDLVTGSTMCDGSNSKPAVPLKQVRLSGHCPDCMGPWDQTEVETYPGSLSQYGGYKDVECTECGPGHVIRLTDQHVIAEGE